MLKLFSLAIVTIHVRLVFSYVATETSLELDAPDKNIMLMFRDPGPHAKKMMGVHWLGWQKIQLEYKEFEDWENGLVGNVECDQQRKDDPGSKFCRNQGNKTMPFVMYGKGDDVKHLKPYPGAMNYIDLLRFADNNIGPICGPRRLDLCKGKKRGKWEEILQKSEAELQKILDDKDKQIKRLRGKSQVQQKKWSKEYGKRLEREDKLVDKLQGELSELIVEWETEIHKLHIGMAPYVRALEFKTGEEWKSKAPKSEL